MENHFQNVFYYQGAGNVERFSAEWGSYIMFWEQTLTLEKHLILYEIRF
jgi:hypothetical protein